MSWLCRCGNWFIWNRKGVNTKPLECPECGGPGDKIQALDT